MNRTRFVVSATFCLVLRAVPGQQDPPAPGAAAIREKPPENARVTELVTAMQKAEAAARTVWLAMATEQHGPEGLAVTTRGTLRVLRGEHPAVHTVVEYEFGNGLRGRMESARTEAGVLVLEDNPAQGETLTHIDPATATDLEWAGEVLEREAVPGLQDARSQAPLGSAMLADLARVFDLQPLPRRERDGQAGTWLGGSLRSGLQPETDPEVPLGDRVEVFVREPDQALLEVAVWQGPLVIQRIVVTKIEIDRPMTAELFAIDGKGLRQRSLREQPAAWEQVQKLLEEAETRAAAAPGDGPKVRPSRRK
ncbi:MAG: hypothetical protein IPK26_29500 [Planctomycetes bacterium]|nr:hypothetical protein [Planctomycetota bacterium]